MQLFIYSSASIISGVILLAMFMYRYREIAIGKVEVPARKRLEERLSYIFFLKALELEKEFLLFVSKSVSSVKGYDWSRVTDNPITKRFGKKIEKIIRDNMTNGEKKSSSSFFREISEHKEKMRNGNKEV